MEQSNTTVVHAFPRDSPRQIQTKATNKGLFRLLIKNGSIKIILEIFLSPQEVPVVQV